MKNLSYISVIIPIYNSKNWISRMVNSVLCQSFTDFELILVDDGSNDGSEDIIDDYSKKDNRIKVIHKKNGGSNSARQAGFDIAKGEYYIIVDADDWMEPNMLEEMYDKAKEKNADIVICALEHVYQNMGKIIHDVVQSRPTSLSKNTLYKDMLNGKCDIATWNKLIKRSVAIENKLKYPTEITIFEDIPMSLYLAKVSKVVAYTPKVLYHYDQCTNLSSITNPKNSTSIDKRMLAIDYFLHDESLRPMAYKYAIWVCIYFSLRYTILSKKEFKERFRQYKFKGLFIKTPKMPLQAYFFAFTAMYLSFDLASFVMKLKLKRLKSIK